MALSEKRLRKMSENNVEFLDQKNSHASRLWKTLTNTSALGIWYF